jgi:hypothetical protein
MTRNYPDLNAEKAFIWRIIHRDNLSWVLQNGVHCANSRVQAPAYVAIGNTDLINRRRYRNVPVAPGGTLSDYVPFYFTPFSPMMYNIYTGRGEVPKRPNDEICILVSSLHRVAQMGIQSVFTDRHAYPPLARYFNDLRHLDQIDWPLIQARNFTRNPDDPIQIERYQAEALVYQHLPVNALLGVVCHTAAVKAMIDAQARANGVVLDVKAISGWYF